MLLFAGVFRRDFAVHSKFSEKGRKHLVTIVDPIGDLLARGGQGDQTVLVHENVIVLAQALHRHAYARFRHVQLRSDVH